MAISRNHWRAPDFYDPSDWEDSEQLSHRLSLYDREVYTDLEHVRLTARGIAKGILLGLVSIAAIVCGAYLIGRIAVWIALALA